MNKINVVLLMILFVSCNTLKNEIPKDNKVLHETEKISFNLAEVTSKLNILANSNLAIQTQCPFKKLPIDHNLYFDIANFRIYTCCKSCLEIVRKNPLIACESLERKHQRPIKITEILK